MKSMVQYIPTTRRALSQFWSFKISRTTLLNYIKFVDPRNLRPGKCEKARRVLDEPFHEFLEPRGLTNFMTFRNVARRISKLSQIVKGFLENVAKYIKNLLPRFFAIFLIRSTKTTHYPTSYFTI